MHSIALLLYSLLALIALAFSAKYLRARTFMPYHEVIIGKPWSAIEPRVQSVVSGMLRIIGGGLLVAGVSLLWLLIPLAEGKPWAAYAATSVVMASSTPTLLVLGSLKRLEPAANPPIIPTAASMAVSLLALVLYLAATP
jgi:hypothetical protein